MILHVVGPSFQMFSSYILDEVRDVRLYLFKENNIASDEAVLVLRRLWRRVGPLPLGLGLLLALALRLFRRFDFRLRLRGFRRSGPRRRRSIRTRRRGRALGFLPRALFFSEALGFSFFLSFCFSFSRGLVVLRFRVAALGRRADDVPVWLRFLGHGPGDGVRVAALSVRRRAAQKMSCEEVLLRVAGQPPGREEVCW